MELIHCNDADCERYREWLSAEKAEAEKRARAVMAEALAGTPLNCCDELHQAKVQGLEGKLERLRTELAEAREQTRVVRRVGEDETARAANEAMDAERRMAESRRAVDNVALSDLRRERDAAQAEAKSWHDTYQQHANDVAEFLGVLLDLLPGAQDTGSDAYDQIPRGIRSLRAERDALKADRNGFKTALARTAQQLGHSEAAIDRVQAQVRKWREHYTTRYDGAADQIEAALDTPTPTEETDRG